MAGMATGAEIPQGLLNHSAGCAGTTAAVSAGCNGATAQASAGCAGTRSAPVRGVLATVNDRRPHLLGRAVDAGHQFRVERAVAKSTGCVGSCGVAVKVQATGCSGGFALMPTTGQRTVIAVAPAAPAAPQVVGGPFHDHRAIRAFLIRHGVPESKIAAHEARVGGSGSVDWMALLMAFVKGGIQAVLALLGGG